MDPAGRSVLVTESARSINQRFFSFSKQNLILVLTIVALTLVLYDPVKNFQFVNYDDDIYINQQVKQGLTWKNIGWSFTTMEVSNWHPLTWISLFIVSSVFHGSPAGFHYVNLLLHALNAALLFQLLNTATGYRWRSFFVAALFAVHPLNVESVAWVSEFKSVLSTPFFLLAMMAYRRYALSLSIKHYLLVAGYFVLGLMAKPMVITLPCVLLLWDFWPLYRWNKAPGPAERALAVLGPARSLKVLLLEKIPLLILSVASGFLTIIAAAAAGGISSIESFPIAFRLANVAISYAKYLFKTFWPVHLTVLYSPVVRPSARQLCVAIALLALISIAVVLRMRRQPYLAVGWLWYLGVLVPVIGILQVGAQGIANHFAYLPIIGVFIALVWAIADWTSKLPYRAYSLGTTGVLVLAALFADSRAQLSVWKDSLSLWSHAIEVDDNFKAELKYAESLKDAGRSQEELARFALLAARYPERTLTHFNYGASLLRNHQAEKAIPEFQRVVRAWAENSEMAYVVMRSHYNLGLAYLQTGNMNPAETELKQALRMDPSAYDAYLQLGILYQQQNRCQDAIPPLALSLKMIWSNAGLLSFGICLEQQNKLQEARAAFQEALKISPDYAPAQTRLREVEARLAQKKGP